MSWIRFAKLLAWQATNRQGPSMLDAKQQVIAGLLYMC